MKFPTGNHWVRKEVQGAKNKRKELQRKRKFGRGKRKRRIRLGKLNNRRPRFGA